MLNVDAGNINSDSVFEMSTGYFFVRLEPFRKNSIAALGLEASKSRSLAERSSTPTLM